MRRKGKWVKTDGWRGYMQPAGAVLGASDTGMWSDSPCPSKEVCKEMRMARKQLLKTGIKTRQRVAQSSNAFMMKRWLIAEPMQEKKAKQEARKLMNKIKSKTRYLHLAD